MKWITVTIVLVILTQHAIIILKGTSGQEHPFRLHVGHDKLIHH